MRRNVYPPIDPVLLYASIGMCWHHNNKPILTCGCAESLAYIQSAYDENDARDFNASQCAELPDNFETPAVIDPDEADRQNEIRFAREGF